MYSGASQQMISAWHGAIEAAAKMEGRNAADRGAVKDMNDEQFARYPSLKDRVVLVTGGATGIGESIVRHFARQGSRVSFLDVQDGPGRALADELASEGCQKPDYLHCDLTDVAALQAAVAQVLAKHGTVDVLVNNAANDQRHKIEDVTPEYWDQSVAINLRPQFFMVQAVLPAMKAAGRGAIINLSSISWIIPSTGLPVYVTAKAAIVGMTRTLAKELGPHGIRVNAVLPGGIATEKQKRLVYTPEYKAEIIAHQSIKRDLVPEDVARLVLFLASDDSSAITSQRYVVDGGWV
jgi:NAD(P)-dependent dehydrogenase (short-subunit alcohol dehydrogenase family)